MTIGRVLPENSERATKQKSLDITVIVGNPPYSAWQESANDANQNLKYPQLDDRIASTYAEHSTATNKNSLYDSYVRAIRWASDRVGDKGIVCFVTNGGFMDGNAADGLRKTLIDEFSSLYIFNLRGNARTSGEQRRKEKGNVFGEGTRTNIAISLLVKNPDKTNPGKLHYHDIGDYLSREEKLQTILELGSIAGTPWQSIVPNERHDWINQRGDEFQEFLPLGDKSGADSVVVFTTYSNGLKTNRDAWAYNFSHAALSANMMRMVDFYNSQVDEYASVNAGKPEEEWEPLDAFLDSDTSKISWSRGLKADVFKAKHWPFQPERIYTALYRPYVKQRAYFDRPFNDMVYQMPRLFPFSGAKNLVISVTGRGSTKPFSSVMTDCLPDLEAISKSQCFPLYVYEPSVGHQESAFGGASITLDGNVRRNAITDSILDRYHSVYCDPTITKEDIFYYVYGVLHSPEYRERFEADLKKEVPRIPYARDFQAFTQAGRKLGHLHVNYETAPKYGVTVANTHPTPDSREALRVNKMRFAKKDDKSRLKFNTHITISDIPDETHEYQVNGKSALEWLIDRYQVKTDKKSGIENDPNEWSDDPCYILDLVQRVITVSVETVRIVNSLPPLEEIDVENNGLRP